MEVKSDVIKNNIAQEPGIKVHAQVHESRKTGSGQTGDGKSGHWHFRNQ